MVLICLDCEGQLALSSASGDHRSSRECALARRYIGNHFKETLRLDQLAQLAHVNKYYLAYALHREFNALPLLFYLQTGGREPLPPA